MESGQLISARRSGAPRADPGEPGPAGLLGHHAVAVRRPAADPAGRGRAQPPPHPVGAAPDRRGQRRLHRGGGRARDHAPGRLHHHAVLDLARPRQRCQRAGGVARRPGHPDRAHARLRLRRELPAGHRSRVSRPEGDSLARYGNNLLPIDYEPASRTSPVFAYPYARTRESLEHLRACRRAARGARLQDAVRESGHRRLRHAHHGHLRAAAAGGFCRARLPQHRRDGVSRHRGRGHGGGRRAAHRASARATPSWCRPGSAYRFEAPTATRCCSASPIARCSARSICGAKSCCRRDADPAEPDSAQSCRRGLVRLPRPAARACGPARRARLPRGARIPAGHVRSPRCADWKRGRAHHPRSGLGSNLVGARGGTSASG